MEHDALHKRQGAAARVSFHDSSGVGGFGNTRPAGLPSRRRGPALRRGTHRDTGVASVDQWPVSSAAAALVRYNHYGVARLSGRAGATRIARSASVSCSTGVACGSSAAGVTRVAGVASVARGTSIAGASHAAGVARVTGVTRGAGIAGASHASRVAGVAGAAGVTRVTGVTRCSWGSSRTRTRGNGEHHE